MGVPTTARHVCSIVRLNPMPPFSLVQWPHLHFFSLPPFPARQDVLGLNLDCVTKAPGMSGLVCLFSAVVIKQGGTHAR